MIRSMHQQSDSSAIHRICVGGMLGIDPLGSFLG